MGKLLHQQRQQDRKDAGGQQKYPGDSKTGGGNGWQLQLLCQQLHRRFCQKCQSQPEKKGQGDGKQVGDAQPKKQNGNGQNCRSLGKFLIHKLPPEKFHYFTCNFENL